MNDRLVAAIPAHRMIYRLCKRYCDRYNGDNNGDIQTNGELRLMRSILPNSSTVFDVGANVGDWTALALNINSDLNIHCFEPSVETFLRLQSRLSRATAICNNYGLSSLQGELTLHVFADGSGENSLYRRQGLEEGWGRDPQSRTELVRMQTLDDYCRLVNVQNIDFLKVDVEGHELEVFKGATEMLKNNAVKYIQFEYGGCNIDSRTLLRDLFAFFAQYQYSLFKIFPNELRHRARYDQRMETFEYQNWVAVANGAPIPK